MRVNKGKGLAIALIVLGTLMLLGKFTPFFGHLIGSIFGLVFPLIMIALGYYGIKRGNAGFGWIIMIIGVLVLISKLAWLIGPFIAIGLIIFGISMLKDRRRPY
ncbi:hypothetical protein Q5741_21075 [Paenibacillus sp. JX-17]|uniref:LiaF transmembrane domain-containing protein n=1 Tax=Paenibacillus lacisoli TaxID=3064525 RepID=A0ABT9CHY0_9BACL|nr:hypothetical protein [Paenibacillus sp. JX-17]MDO7908879.1 hypothetical protein [Paenibacillus sp. JX-17]